MWSPQLCGVVRPLAPKLTAVVNAPTPAMPNLSCWPSAEPGLVVGHHQAQRACQMDLLPSVRYLGRLQPLRRRLADRARECNELAQQLIADTVACHDVMPGTLTLHADRGTSMRSKPVAGLLVDLDVTKGHSLPYTSDDNPYSESQFKTMKYRPDFPQRFDSIEDARSHCGLDQPSVKGKSSP